MVFKTEQFMEMVNSASLCKMKLVFIIKKKSNKQQIFL